MKIRIPEPTSWRCAGKLYAFGIYRVPEDMSAEEAQRALDENAAERVEEPKAEAAPVKPAQPAAVKPAQPAAAKPNKESKA